MCSHEDFEAKISRKISTLEVDLCGPAKISTSSHTTPSKPPPPLKLKTCVDKIFSLESKYLIKSPSLQSATMDNHEDPRSSSSPFTPPSIIRESSSAFSKPILPSSSSLLSPKPQFGSSSPDPSATRYRECLKNHAASLGGHVIDGCGEFMPAGPADPLKCAACGCHRSFHRKEPEPDSPSNPKPSYRVPLLLAPHPNPIRFNGNTKTNTNTSADQSSSEERVNYTSNVNSVGNYNHGSVSDGRKKRFRTKFSGEQKKKMKAFAERVGWRVQKKDEGEMERFCNEVGISRQVLKVWMHNNKHLVKKQDGNFAGIEIKVEGLIQQRNQQEGNGA